MLLKWCRGYDILAWGGAWRSPVAHLHGVQRVVGSNPTAPTSKLTGKALLPLDGKSVFCSPFLVEDQLGLAKRIGTVGQRYRT